MTFVKLLLLPSIIGNIPCPCCLKMVINIEWMCHSLYNLYLYHCYGPIIDAMVGKDLKFVRSFLRGILVRLIQL